MSPAATPEPPYVAVLFSNVRTEDDEDGYGAMAAAMEALAARQPGFLGIESVRDPVTRFGITVSYWTTEADARAWKGQADHLGAQHLGRQRWYATYVTRIAVVGRAYGFNREG